MRIDMVSEHASPLAVVKGADASGRNVHVAELSQALAARGHSVVVHTRRTSPDLPEEVELCPGAHVRHVDAGPPEPLGDDPPPYTDAFAENLARRWVQDPPDLVHAHYWTSGRAALGAAAAAGLPVVQTFHALLALKRLRDGAPDTGPPERGRVETMIARRADLVVATSTQEQRVLRERGVEPDRVAVVPSGVDPERFRPEGPTAPRGDAPQVLFLGRLVRRKGVDTVVRAMAGVPEAELAVAGGPGPDGPDDGDEAERLHAVAEEAGVADRVRFLGAVPREEVPEHFRAADLVVNMPWYEPFGITTVEAMGCGAAVIASAVGGHLDTVVNDVTGRLLPPARPRALAFRMRQLLADPVTREGYGFAAADRVAARYGWETVAARMERCYERVLRVRGREPEPVVERQGALVAARAHGPA
ncbi:glycosyltransferase [Nocardiopsis sp. RSe5-2]|uniref:Glycosyltransferase n=1 Tax=Nocardiopsis endophytica TaxID=3018445 RepID=A0ABT4U7C7_9ACTN|nr:glycosyltransferase [Nocardiopsis endophytica]MDA2812858.1 glycosyltransferase [Nocardiopsis endophytica]